MVVVHKIIRKIMKFFINLDYLTNPDKDALISVGICTKHDDHDFTLVVNRY